MKALVTDLMHESAHIYAQLSGANGYKIDHIAGRGIIDSRPFQIFEGANEMLYTQIAETTLKKMKKKKEGNLYRYLLQAETSHLVVAPFQKFLHFEPAPRLVQRQLVVLGKVIARLICLQYVYNLVDKGYRDDLYINCTKHIKTDIKKLLSDFSTINDAAPIVDHKTQSDC